MLVALLQMMGFAAGNPVHSRAEGVATAPASHAGRLNTSPSTIAFQLGVMQ